MSTVIEIVSAHLRTIGADGLVCPDAECGCKLGELTPCSGDFGACQPGYLAEPCDPEQDDWTMWTTKERAEEENARIKAGQEGGDA